MSTQRILRLFVIALGASSPGWQAATAEPVNPTSQSAATDDIEARDSQARGKLKDASASLEVKDYEAAITKYTKFIDNVGVEGSCLD